MGLIDMQGKVTLVTGGARGIGRGIVTALAGAGASVAIADLRADLAEQTASEVARDTGTHVMALKADVANLVEVQEMTERVLQTFGKIDVLINNAGWDELKPFLQTTPDFWEKIIAINYRSVLNTCYAVLPYMVTRKAGAVVSISSDAGRVGSMGEAVYAGTKAAIIAFSRTLAREHARDNIRFNVVCPGPTQTPPGRGNATAGIWQPGAGTHGAVCAAEAPGKIGRCRPDSCVFSFRCRRLHHRAGDQCQRRTDHGGIMITPPRDRRPPTRPHRSQTMTRRRPGKGRPWPLPQAARTDRQDGAPRSSRAMPACGRHPQGNDR